MSDFPSRSEHDVLRVDLLGPIRAWRNGREITLGPPKQRAVFSVLATRSNNLVLHHEIIDAVWGEMLPLSAANSVHTYVSGLRRSLEPGQPPRSAGTVLTSAAGGYILKLNISELDIERFTQISRSAQESYSAGNLESAERLCESALGLWRGEAYSGIPGPFAEIERSRLLELKLSLEELRADAMLALGRHDKIVSHLVALASEHPFREKIRSLLMLALYRGGRRADALRVFRETRVLLVRELGIEPGADLSRLNGRMLTSDASLDLVRAPRAVAVRALDEDERAARSLAQLPRRVPAFHGRDHELALLRRLARDHDDGIGGDSATVAVVHGMAGVGKTALVVQFAHSVLRDFPDGQLFVDLHRCRPSCTSLSPFGALGFILRSLGVAPHSVPGEIGDRAAMYRSLVNEKKLLIVLDNATSPEQLRWLLPGSSSCLTLVTSRNRLAGLVARDGAYGVPLTWFDQTSSLKMLASILGFERVAAEHDYARELAHLSGHLPFALRIAGLPLTADPTMKISHLLEGLRDERRRLDLLSVEGDPSATLRSLFACSYQALPPETARLFRVLGRHGAPYVSLETAARLSQLHESETVRNLRTLVQSHLITPRDPHRYHLHSLLRIYARECDRKAWPGRTELAKAVPITRQGSDATNQAWYRTSHNSDSIHPGPTARPCQAS